ncbi:MAG: hypothetical protein CVV37_08215 [Nitrospira bacterium HGW-Nitrospira-1]|nr:MAG: hypothetical protein CVV37_08215 [Nitrospira bacterium HGW-Nitrospira-1]
MTASGSAKLVMNPATANGGDPAVSGGAVKCGFNPNGSFRGRVDFPGRSGTGFLAINSIGYTVINSLGAVGSTTKTDLQGMNGDLTGHYALGSDIDASATPGWNGGKGFTPVGYNGFTGAFNGLGHTIKNLYINRYSTINNSTYNRVGLFATISNGATIRNVGMVNGNIAGSYYVGGLVGWSNQGVGINVIANSYNTGTVKGVYCTGGLVGISYYGGVNSYTIITDSYNTGVIDGTTGGNGQIGGYVGGLVGAPEHYNKITNSYNIGEVKGTYLVGGLLGILYDGSILTNSYNTGKVTGSLSVGGLVGASFTNSNKITNSYSIGSVTGTDSVGGLVGGASNTNITNTYSAGKVTGVSNVGGLIGSKDSTVTVNNSFWDKDTSGQATSAGGTGKTMAEMKTLSTFTNAGWDIDNQGGTGKIWRIYEGETYPLLRYWLRPLTVTAKNDSKTYNGLAYSGGNGVTYNCFINNDPLPSQPGGTPLEGILTYGGDSQGAKNVGSYAITARAR